MRCKCGGLMKARTDKIFGEKVNVSVCEKCGKRLVDVDEAIKLQKTLLPKIHEERMVIKVGTSHAITIPSKLSPIFPVGEKVVIKFDPQKNKLEIEAK